MLLFINCSKDDNNEIQTTGDTFYTVMVGDETIEFDEEEISASSFLLVNGILLTDISGGYEVGAKSINISLANITSIGTYTLLDPEAIINLGQTTSHVSLCTYSDRQTEWVSTRAFQDTRATTVTITELNDNYIAGSFSFIGGDFSDLSLNPVPQKTITGSFKAKID